MNTQDVRADIARLEAVRRQTQFWRLGASLALLATTLGSLAMIRNSINGLLQPGPTQEQFTTQLSANLQRDVVPSLQTLASQTLTQMRPQVETEFSKLNGRVPELSQAAVTQFDALQTNLPVRGQKALETSFGALLVRKEAEIKKQFPDATDEKIKALSKNVSDEAAERIVASRDTLFSKHLSSLNSIVGHLTTIQDTERVPAEERAADWDLIVAVLDMAHHDATNLAAADKNASASQSAKGASRQAGGSANGEAKASVKPVSTTKEQVHAQRS